MPIKRAVLGLFTLLLVCTTRAFLVNRTIDDTNGDPITRLTPVYLPKGPWNGQNCTSCAINPNASLAFDGTWSAATYNPGPKKHKQHEHLILVYRLEMFFQCPCFQILPRFKLLYFAGVAVWIFFILANANDLPSGTTSTTACNITIDGVLVGDYSSPQPNKNTPAYQYNVSVYSADNFSNHAHIVVISTNDYPINVYLNFDCHLHVRLFHDRLIRLRF